MTNPTVANTTISSRSVLLPDRLQIVSRIQSPLFSGGHFFKAPFTEIRVTLSENAPGYLDSAKETAVLDLANSTSASFIFDRAAGSFAKYTQLVEALGV